MRFVTDPALGGLVKWLRFCGFDAACQKFSASDPQSLPPLNPDTVILTRQAGLYRLGRKDLVLLEASTPEEQLREVFQRLQIARHDLAPLSRCVRCNQALIQVSRDEVLGRVPEHVFHSQREFSECPKCRRVYWPGSHLAAITAKLARILHLPETDDHLAPGEPPS